MRRTIINSLPLVLGIVALVTPATAVAATINVDIRTDELNSNGSCSLREAADAANQDSAILQNEPGCETGTGSDTIALTAGTPYTLTIPIDGTPGINDGDLELTDPDGVTILGEGRVTTVVDGGDHDRIFEVTNGPFTLNAATVRNGTAATLGGGGILSAGNVSLTGAGVVENQQTAAAAAGGGIALSAGAALTASGDTAINDNVSAGFGGGINKDGGGNVTLGAGVSVNGNDAVGRGGGMFLGGNLDLTLNGASVSNNDLAESPAQLAVGSAIHFSGDLFSFTNATINGNDAVADRAIAAVEMFANNASTIHSSAISGNTVTGQDDADGDFIGPAAMRFNVMPGVTISDSTIAQNMAIGADAQDFSAGAGISTIMPLRIIGSTFASNTLSGTASSQFAGALYIDNATSTEILNSTFTGNVAPSAAGAINLQANGSLTVVHSTFSGNVSPQGQAINTQGGAGSAVIFRGTIFDDGASACSFGVPHGVTSDGFNVDAGTSCVDPFPGGIDDTDYENTDASLGPLANNGGPTQTMELLGPANLIDGAGACTGLDGVTPLAVDQRGYPRPFGAACDPGAYERYLCNGAVVNTPGPFQACPLPPQPGTNPAPPPPRCAALRKKLKRAIATGDKARAKKLRAKLRRQGCPVKRK